MQKFKVGDRVRCVPGRANAEWSAGRGYQAGLEFKVTFIRTNPAGRHCYFGGFETNGVYEDALEAVKKPLAEAQKGDILVEKGTYRTTEYKVLARLGDLVFLSDEENFEISGNYFTVKELEDEGYEVQEPVEELTIEQIEEQLGKKVKIVEE